MAPTLRDVFGLTGKVAVVTGGSRGLGKEIAETLAMAGADIVLNARDATRLADVAQMIEQVYEVQVLPVPGDIADPNVVSQIIDTAVQKLGRLDILVNNAGVNVRGEIEKVEPEDFDRVFATNVRGPWLLCRQAAPIFKKQKSGRVINIASTLGLVARSERSLYCSSKGAVVQLTRELAVEWAECGITVNAICPGPFKTEMNRVLFEDEESNKLFAQYTAMHRWGESGELAPAVLFLTSPASGYVTGAMIPVDGGWLAKS